MNENKYMDNVMQSSKEILETTDFLVGLSKKLLAGEEDDYLWTEKLWEWADINNISYFLRTRFPFEEDEIAENKKNFLNLKELDFTECSLNEFPGEMGYLTNLKSLGLGGNMLNEVPVEIGQLIKLEKLYLWNNQLKELPKEIVNLVNLRQLYLNDNPSLVLSQDQKEWIIELEINNCDVKINEDNDPDLLNTFLIHDIDLGDEGIPF